MCLRYSKEMNLNSKFALITGTTSGIGKAFADLLADLGYNIVLVSRDEIRMKQQALQLRDRTGVNVELLCADLTLQRDRDLVVLRLEERARPIEILVNNAGFGINSDFTNSSIRIQQDLIECMVTSTLQFSHAVIPSMKQIGSGYIINVSSVAGFMAGSTYCSAKSWVTNFSESLHKELAPHGINIHVICPGFTKTEFHLRCKQDVSGVPNIFWLKPEKVASLAYSNVLKGKVLSVPGFHYKLLVALHSYAPRSVVRGYGSLAKRFLRRGGRNL
jgi:short-subunit dehydrogenase